MRVLITLLLLALTALPVAAQGLPPVKVGFASAMSGPSAITGEGVRWAGPMLQDEYYASIGPSHQPV
jgi:hypothetical protein